MAVRPTMSYLIAKVRQMIFDLSGPNQFFADQDIQDELDSPQCRDDIRYELLQMAPAIVNAGNNSHLAQYIWADYYSSYDFWESDVVIQGNNVTTGYPWIVLTPLNSELIVGHFQFELDVFNSGTVPGQWPPVYATGKVYDRFMCAANLLDFWSAALVASYDINVDGQSLKRSQMAQAKQNLANKYRMQAKMRVGHMVRNDVNGNRRNLQSNDNYFKYA